MSTATTSRTRRAKAHCKGSRRTTVSRGPSPEEKLVADLVALMEQGTAPWRREWQGQQG